MSYWPEKGVGPVKGVWKDGLVLTKFNFVIELGRIQGFLKFSKSVVN